jgi:hypothetical protein
MFANSLSLTVNDLLLILCNLCCANSHLVTRRPGNRKTLLAVMLKVKCWLQEKITYKIIFSLSELFIDFQVMSRARRQRL